jgi:hypothetical protein
MRESDEQFLERFLLEIEPAVQPMGRVTAGRLIGDDDGPHVRIEILVDSRVGPIELILEGDSLLEAASGWEQGIAEARLALSFREVMRA